MKYTKAILIGLVIGSSGLVYLAGDSYSKHTAIEEQCILAYDRINTITKMVEDSYILGKTKQGDMLLEHRDWFKGEIQIACEGFYEPTR